MPVIDASVLVCFLLQEPGWRNLAPYVKHCFTVDLAMKECANALWKAFRRGILSEENFIRKTDLLLKLFKRNVKAEEEEGLIPDALRLSLKEGLSIYDSLYIALARKKKLPLVTLDAIQAEVARKNGVEVIIPRQP